VDWRIKVVLGFGNRRERRKLIQHIQHWQPSGTSDLLL